MLLFAGTTALAIITGSSPRYAQTPSAGAKTTALESLAKLVTKGFASADKKFAALAEDVVAVEKRLDARLDKSDAKIDGVESTLARRAMPGLQKNLTTFSRGWPKSRSPSASIKRLRREGPRGRCFGSGEASFAEEAIALPSTASRLTGVVGA